MHLRKCISELLETGDLCREVDWIIPEDGMLIE